MNNTTILNSILILGSTSIIIALLLSYAAKKFKITTDPKKEILLSLLPGANCAACGYAGCEQYADAILNNTAELSLCKPGGAALAKKIAELLGTQIVFQQRVVALVMCAGGNKAKDEFLYFGIKRCDIVNKFYNGQKMCKYGCLGFGDCVDVCPFDAIYINSSGVAEVDLLKCTGCGLCVKGCPTKAIVGEIKKTHYILDDKCVGCGNCKSVCRFNA
ncbi:MAG: RnfABCDGE type electron transport complex subunit B, partial [Endomicrobia bacterium]|nr:RnfABCDGE type electron transport complex subunit B [Endomicrobiia bacterium]